VRDSVLLIALDRALKRGDRWHGFLCCWPFLGSSWRGDYQHRRMYPTRAIHRLARPRVVAENNRW